MAVSWTEFISTVESVGRIWPTGIARLRGGILVETPKAKLCVLKCEVLAVNCHFPREAIEN